MPKVRKQVRRRPGRREGVDVRRRREGIIDVYLSGYVGEEHRLYHMELLTGKDKEKEPILLPPTATFDPHVIGAQGDWTVCGEHIYWSGGLYQRTVLSEFVVLPQLFRHTTSKYGLKQWQIEPHVNHRPFPRSNIFAAADVFNQKLYFTGGTFWFTLDGCGLPDKDRCGECLDLVTHTWSSLYCTPAEEILKYDPSCEVAVKVRNCADEPMEMVYYDLYAGSILFLDLTNGGSRHLGDVNFAVLGCPLERVPPGLKQEDIDEFVMTIGRTRAVVTEQTFYWLTFDLRLFAYDIKAKTWFKPLPLSGHLPPPCSTCPYDGFYPPTHPLLLGLSNQEMVAIIFTSPGELTAAFLQVRTVCDDTYLLLCDVGDTQAYYIDIEDPTNSDTEPFFTPTGGEALLRNTDGARAAMDT